MLKIEYSKPRVSSSSVEKLLGHSPEAWLEGGGIPAQVPGSRGTMGSIGMLEAPGAQQGAQGDPTHGQGHGGASVKNRLK